MKKILTLLLAAFFLSFVTGCNTITSLSSSSSAPRVASLTADTSLAISAILVSSSSADRTKIANALYSGARGLAAQVATGRLTPEQFQAAARALLPAKDSAALMAKYDTLALALTLVFNEWIDPNLSPTVAANQALVLKFASAIEAAALPWTSSSSSLSPHSSSKYLAYMQLEEERAQALWLKSQLMQAQVVAGPDQKKFLVSEL